MTDHTYPLSALDIRRQCRTNSLRKPTAGLCPSATQANLLILPARYADDFRQLCARNPVPCPLIGESPSPGDPKFPLYLAADGDIRTDGPKYHIYVDGKLDKVTDDIVNDWEDDSVAFFLGCSFTFESSLAEAHLAPRHLERGTNVAMYKTRIPLNPAGVFTGSLVVSMRPYKLSSVPEVRKITRGFTKSHGEPIAWGFESVSNLGTNSLAHPEFGDPVDVYSEAGEVPVFWGCGVTAQIAVMESLAGIGGVKVIGHAPGYMICCDSLT